MQATNRGFLRLLGAQAQVAFNDNAIKLVLMGVAQMVLSPTHAAWVISLLAFLMVTPFVLFAPLAGWIADRFPKRDVILGSLALQLGVIGVLLASIFFKCVEGLLLGFFLLGIQATIFSPAKRGIIKELVPSSRIGSAVGIMEMLSIFSILLGSVCGGKLIDGLALHERDAWSAAWTALMILGATCAAAFLAFWSVPRRPAARPNDVYSWNLLVGHFSQVKKLHAHTSLFRAALGDAAFYFLGGVLTLIVANIGSSLFTNGIGAAGETGIMLALIGFGIAIGSIVTAVICRRSIRLGMVPIGAFGIAVAFLLLATSAPQTLPFYAMLILLGISGGIYLVPLGAWLVDRSPEESRGSVLAASGLLSSVAGILAVGFHWMLAQVFHLSIASQFGVLGGLTLIVAVCSLKILPDEFLRLVALATASLRYKVTVKMERPLPATGGALLICNHVSYVDTLPLSLASTRPMRFMSYEGFFSFPVLGSILRIFKCIPVRPAYSRDALRKAVDSIKAGELVCIFPEGQLTRTGALSEIKPGFEIIARMAKCPVIVAHLDGLWGSIFSFKGGRYFTKFPRGFRRHVTVSFAASEHYEEICIKKIRQKFLHLEHEARHERNTRKLFSSSATLPHAVS